jgi:hypothetical protein
MALRKLLMRPLPEPPEQAPGWKELVDQTLSAPMFQPARLFILVLNDMRPWWPVLLPLLLWVFWSKYRGERARFLAERGAGLDY